MADLSRLFHRQWALPILISIARKKPLTVARQTYQDTVAALVEQGLLGKDGSLTARGHKISERGEALLSALGKSADLRKWALPILHVLGRKAHRFGELKAALPGATPRAISMALKDLVEEGLVNRRVLDGFPPRTEYLLEHRARGIAPLLDQLARV